MGLPFAPRLAGRAALVTGAGSGFGRAIGQRFAQHGARVGLADLNLDAARATQRLIEDAGGTALAIACDVTQWPSMQAAVAAHLARFERLDVMVNNAGIALRETFLELTEAGWDRLMAVNLTGVFHGTRAAAEVMVPAQSGCIINMSSIREDVGGFTHTAYCASKGGVRMLTKAAAVELAPHGIRVCAIGPGVSVTPLARALMEDAAVRDRLLARIPLGRFGTVDDIADVALFLASDDASYVTGTTLMADGGELTH